jgi:hypothetical protein
MSMSSPPEPTGGRPTWPQQPFSSEQQVLGVVPPRFDILVAGHPKV